MYQIRLIDDSPDDHPFPVLLSALKLIPQVMNQENSCFACLPIHFNVD